MESSAACGGGSELELRWPPTVGEITSKNQRKKDYWKNSVKERMQARGETEWRDGEGEACVRTDVIAKKNKGSHLSELNPQSSH